MATTNWYNNAVIYHIYPLGYVGAESENSFGEPEGNGKSPILKVIEQIPVLKEMGFNTIYFGPVFESTEHGYDTADYTKIDNRLGTNDDFAVVCKALHDNGFSVVLDGVFNHVGRDFWAFKDVKEKGFNSKYTNWFHVRTGNSNYNDGFYYEGWEGHFNLVKLNLSNPEVREHIFNAVKGWYEEFGIDGLRLDVAYCLDLHFLKELSVFCQTMEKNFWLMGETLHGDYNKWMNREMLHSVTNYECYKGLYSSFNELNMFEIAYSLNRQFGSESWCLYRGQRLYTFVDNHDVSRIASILKDKKHLPGIYTLLFTMPGIPGVYYASEYAAEGLKADGDISLRIKFELSEFKRIELTDVISKLAHAHASLKPLHSGDYKQLVLQNRHFAFSRSCDGETVYTLINVDSAPVTISLNTSGVYSDIFTGKTVDTSAGIELPAYGSMVLFRANA